MKSPSRYRWYVVFIFFIFILLHQTDKLVIASLVDQIRGDFSINRAQFGRITTLALLVGAVFYPLWGYLFDRYARPKLLALASLIWGATTWLNALARSFPVFQITRASTGVDDSSYAGLFSLTSDYFPPKLRGRVYGLLQVAMPLGFMMGMVLGLFLGSDDGLGWRKVFILTGSLGIVLAVVIYFSVKERPRGQSEPELADIDQTGKFSFNWNTARGLFKIKSLRLLFIQGFFGVFPWNVISLWFIDYLKNERFYNDGEVFITMGLAVGVLSAGYPIGGALGDYLFQRTKRGRIIVAGIGVLLGALLMVVTLFIPLETKGLFLFMLALTALFIPFSSPNVISSVYDVSLPEVRSTALSIQYLIESSGAALSPWLAGIIADQSSLRASFLIICVSTWLICALFYVGVAYYIPQDITNLHQQLEERAINERREASAPVNPLV